MMCSSASNSLRSGTTRAPVTSIRWLAMMRCASSASSGLTEILTSPMPSTTSGKIDRGRSDDINDGMPWASSRPRTTRASISERLLNTTISSSNGLSLDFHNDHRDVVMLRLAVDKRRNLVEQTLTDGLGRFLHVRLEKRDQ